jgi:hypothetical protein
VEKSAGHRRYVRQQAATPVLLPYLEVPQELYLQMEPPPPTAAFDWEQWVQIAEARAALPPDPVSVYSTFPGEPPDVWPELPPVASGGSMAAVLMSGAAALLFGIMLVRWQSARIRITRRRDDYRAAWISEPGDRRAA